MHKGWLLIIFILGVVVGLYFQQPSVKDRATLLVSRSKEKKLTNPLLDCELYNDNEPQTRSAKEAITRLLENEDSNYEMASVYYRDLNNGPWFGINEKAKFAPVSLLKVPLMISYLKLAETDPDLLNRKLIYNGNNLIEQNIPLVDQLTPGASYTIDDLIRRMITYSDNASFELLLKNTSASELKKVHRELDIIYPDKNTPEDYLTVKSYAGLFRVLYNSTYLSRKMSERGLGYLLKSDFNLGIRAGLPTQTRAALKFGVKNDPQHQTLLQIHDCGIVYAKSSPYLLCIMTKGTDQDKLVTLVRNISTIIHEELGAN